MAHYPELKIYFRQVLSILEAFIAASDRIIDVGGGPGRFSLAIAPQVASVEHVDFAKAMLDIARIESHRRGISNVSFAFADARSLAAYGDRQFTKALAINTPISFASADWRVALGELCRVAEQAVLFTVTNYLSSLAGLLDTSIENTCAYGNLVESMLSEQTMRTEHARNMGIAFPTYRAFKPGEIESEIRRLNFEVTFSRGIGVLSRLMKSETLKVIVESNEMLANFLRWDEEVAKMYGPLAPSREILFIARRK
jgi:ubiquinone/menaquinone biosynthesis C-methylase UbiE